VPGDRTIEGHHVKRCGRSGRAVRPGPGCSGRSRSGSQSKITGTKLGVGEVAVAACVIAVDMRVDEAANRLAGNLRMAATRMSVCRANGEATITTASLAASGKTVDPTIAAKLTAEFDSKVPRPPILPSASSSAQATAQVTTQR